jgi:hypothetical protein
MIESPSPKHAVAVPSAEPLPKQTDSTASLTTPVAKRRLTQFGYNELPKVKGQICLMIIQLQVLRRKQISTVVASI